MPRWVCCSWRSLPRVSVRGDVRGPKSAGCGGDRVGWGKRGRPGAPRCGVPCCDGGAGSGGGEGGGVGRGAAVSPPCSCRVPGAVSRVCHLKVRGQRTGPRCVLCAALFTHRGRGWVRGRVAPQPLSALPHDLGPLRTGWGARGHLPTTGRRRSAKGLERLGVPPPLEGSGDGRAPPTPPRAGGPRSPRWGQPCVAALSCG